MKILGLQKLTLLDYPDRVAAIVFLGGCNFRCPFCQNSSLVLSPEKLPAINMEEFHRFLKRRAGLLEGICVTGGEPTLHQDLPELFSQIKKAGYLAKLDTNGSHPDMLRCLLQEKLVDYVSIDIKAGRPNYGRVCAPVFLSAREDCASGFSDPRMDSTSGHSASRTDSTSGFSASRANYTSDSTSGFSASRTDCVSGFSASREDCIRDLLDRIDQSISLLKNSSIEYEFRTTVVKELHTEQDFLDIRDWISGAPHYYLQTFRDCPDVLAGEHHFSAFSDQEMLTFLSIVQETIPQARLRG